MPGTSPRRQSRLMPRLLNISATAVPLLYLSNDTVELPPHLSHSQGESNMCHRRATSTALVLRTAYSYCVRIHWIASRTVAETWRVVAQTDSNTRGSCNTAKRKPDKCLGTFDDSIGDMNYPQQRSVSYACTWYHESSREA